ncbi:MAG TPA: septum formation initiator family protein [Chitinophagaceae bacterium]|nr:septum formation initiator family protein [Chitinophagaceae bacterium]
MNRILTHVPAWLKNKYFISFAAFCVVMLFLDKNDFLTQVARTRELNNLRQSKQFYSAKIAAERKQLQAIETNPAAVEKIAREQYLMKRDNEELFIIPENYDSPKN